MSMAKKDRAFHPEIWGGIECTIARIHGGFRDQLQLTGHYGRPSDIDRFAALGIRALRYPVLWERHQPELSAPIDWSQTDERLLAIRRHGILPIVGLLHHGSGPAFTSLDDPDFAGYFANYAAAVATRYPWVAYYTPINEPLTTARFSGLYGIWYPHAREDRLFARMLIHQIMGIVKGMQAIRRVNPSAKLLQTEDLAKVHSTPSLAYQADFENDRRWLTYDLLCGTVDRTHPLYDYLLSAGIREEELSYLTDNPCTPDLLGVNYYITSERYLDEVLEQYPRNAHGGNGKDLYADIAAVRAGRSVGLPALLTEAHQRFGLPIVISEVHMHCTREEQVRWLHEIWSIACQARRRGIPIHAVTSWALIGAYDWDSLLTRAVGHYESGAYSVKNGVLRITAVGHLLRALAIHDFPAHPLLNIPGWWHGRRLIKPQESVLIVGEADAILEIVTDLCGVRGIPFLVVAFIGDAIDLVKSGGIWAIVHISGDHDLPDMSLVGGRLVIRQPYLRIDPGNEQLLVDKVTTVQGLLDDLIDRSIQIACCPITHLTSIPYVEEQVHVCNRH